MKTVKACKQFLAGFLALAFALLAGANAVVVRAAGGTVYTCTINPCYAHPVTGEIEDSGGEASYVTGQGMVEGALSTTGILELTDSGEYYLTIRMSLMDYTANHSFWVQNVGDSGWSEPASMGITGSGTDTNGTTNDICIQVPSENCVIRGSMYVTPMGRDVVFYCYPSNFTAGNSTDMAATIVTEPSGGGQQTAETETAAPAGTTAAAPAETTAAQTETTEAAAGTAEAAETAGAAAPSLENSIQQAASPSASSEEEESGGALTQARGLSLSTAGETADAERTSSSGNSPAVTAFAVGASVTISGLILMSAAAGFLYLFRKNWYRWGGGDDDEE